MTVPLLKQQDGSRCDPPDLVAEAVEMLAGYAKEDFPGLMRFLMTPHPTAMCGMFQEVVWILLMPRNPPPLRGVGKILGDRDVLFALSHRAIGSQGRMRSEAPDWRAFCMA